MTREEVMKRLEEVENNRFYHAMKDRWDAEDFEVDRQMEEEEKKLKEELKKF